MRGLFLGLFILSLGACAVARPIPIDQAANMDCGPFPSDYQERIISAMSKKLIDPYSAQYEFNEPEKATYKDGCGWYFVMGVNAKNRFGGYTGIELHQFIIYQGMLEEVNIVGSVIANRRSRL